MQSGLSGGDGDGLLVLLHGMGATAAVWQPLLADVDQHWPGRWMALDLPGHGGAARLADGYSVGQTAAALARDIRQTLRKGERLVVLGHSLGGLLALALGSGWFGVAPDRVFGFGIKCGWTQADLDRMAANAARPVKIFDNAAECTVLHAKMAGLFGLVEEDSATLAGGVVAEGQGWRLAMDPAVMGGSYPPIDSIRAAISCPFHLARGEGDAMVSLDELRRLDPHAVDLPGGAHNIQVEAPDQVWRWFEQGMVASAS